MKGSFAVLVIPHKEPADKKLKIKMKTYTKAKQSFASFAIEHPSSFASTQQKLDG